MSGLTAVVVLIVGLILAFGGYLGFLYVQHWFKSRYPDPIEIRKETGSTSAGTPPMAWWDELQVLQLRFADLQTAVKADKTDAENSLRLARNAEERARKLRTAAGYEDEDDRLPVAPAALRLPEQPDGWEEVPTAPAGQPVASNGRAITPELAQRLNQRRGR